MNQSEFRQEEQNSQQQTSAAAAAPAAPPTTGTTLSSSSMLSTSTPIRIGGSSSGGEPSSPGASGGSGGGANSNANVMASSVPAATGSGLQSQHQSLHQSVSSSYVGSATAGSQSVGVGGTPPSSAGGRHSAADEKILRRTSMQVLLPKRPSTDSLSNSPGPSSPGIANWGDSSSKFDGSSTDKQQPTDTSKLNRKESYKAQRKNYRREKKRVASELLNSLQDPAVIVLADWLKVRGTLKSWTKLWCVLKPGLLLLYKSPKVKSSHWVGTILLNSCQVIERPSKKDGFCFKLFHPLEQSIWAPRGPDKETIGAVVQPLPTAYLIFRAPSQAAGKCWMDALELSLRCSALLLRSNSNSGGGPNATTDGNVSAQSSHETQWSEADYEKHFNDQDLDADSQNEGAAAVMSGPDSESDSDLGEGPDQISDDPPETPYVPCPEEEFGDAGEQVEELAEEHKSLIWFLMKQVRPGMDLSKVVLPTFILEPRSFLDKLADSYYHADILSEAVLEDDPFTRMKKVVQWYLSGFYKKPKGLKKPYNPIIGETFRCYWQHPNGSRTYYIAEQVSHHPPVSALYVTNRQDGFCITCSILAKSKFYGNSTSAMLEGVATLTLLPRGESYTLTTPYAHCKGILMGTLSMELGGKICIECENTGYKTEIEFKLKPFLGGSEYTNLVTGKVKLGKETLANINGHWDTEIRIKDSRSSDETILFSATPETKQKRLMRYCVPIDAQEPMESERLWQLVSAAIRRDDQVAATEEKTVLEEMQRNAAKERKALCTEWIPTHFQQDLITGQWIYKYADLRPWDPRNDVKQYESEYQVLTKTCHKAPMVRTGSIVSSDPLHVIRAESRQSLCALKPSKRNAILASKSITQLSHDRMNIHSDSSQSNEECVKKVMTGKSIKNILSSVEQVNKTLQEHSSQLKMIQSTLERVQYAPVQRPSSLMSSSISQSTVIKCLVFLFVGIAVSVFFKWLFK
ncbi:oxysterol-binding protein-related protein 8 isoform X2 [Eupeodes corollae]|uniref:oxysterol-binding protein-related protein 8 isoform X2 n=1 Tax=Eupeodes corollae TaxID=290404 RepID=UPI002490C687|nr:oxysterol-binding protein-related protein 8 isoform X2 [Eupeodes corollae]